MKGKITGTAVFMLALSSLVFSFKAGDSSSYREFYDKTFFQFKKEQLALEKEILNTDLSDSAAIAKVLEKINSSRIALKNADFWFRYLEPISYKRVNGPLPVEWETEVFEKFEKPYKREGAGLTLATLYLDEEHPEKDSLLQLVRLSMKAAEAYQADSVTRNLKDYHHFFLCNRLYLLNLAAIYTTGFECPQTEKVIMELRSMMKGVNEIYKYYNGSFSDYRLPDDYLTLYKSAIAYVNNQPANYEAFDHFTFIKNYINPLFAYNQKLIRDYKVVSKSYVDYSLNNNVSSIFSKKLYTGQNSKGVFMRVYDQEILNEVAALGKSLFYDPILSGNNERSCASCHKPDQYFTDTTVATALQFDKTNFLPRNSPSLVNSQYNHLLMMDGKHISMQDQAKGVITNTLEMACDEKELMNKILSCKDYKKSLKKIAKHTPVYDEPAMEHVSSALTFYYSRFGEYYSPFDKYMNENVEASAQVKKGFNIFMGKAQCATCHFLPQFNGVKPPYVGSEFEVLGTPSDTTYKMLSADKGRYNIHPAYETAGAFRTGTVRNAGKTAPYMHNGVFKTLKQVIDFYDGGGGAGRGLKVENQTLSGDSLHLTAGEKKFLLDFIQSLNEDVKADSPPEKLPVSSAKQLNKRKPGGEY